MSVYETLSKINVNEHTEKKNGLTYLSWAWAWAKVKEHYPEATFTVYENRDGMNYHHDGHTAWVKTGVRIDGIEHIEYLPIMDYKNKSILVDQLTSFDVNKAIQRSLTKAVARHGLGLYIYAGEDLPEQTSDQSGMPRIFDYKERLDEEKELQKMMQEEATEKELENFKEACASAGVSYAEIWKQTGKAKDMSKAHLGLAQKQLVNMTNARA